MAFFCNKAFFTRDFSIDYLNKKVDIEPLDNAFFYIIDFIVDYLIKVCFLGIIPSGILLLISPIAARFYLIFCMIFFLFFNILYSCVRSRLLVNLQMMFEYPYHRLVFWKREGIIDLNNVSKIELINCSYWKINLKFYGECKDHRKSIKLDKFQFHGGGRRDMVIEFTKPVSGKIKIWLLGDISDIRRYH